MKNATVALAAGILLSLGMAANVNAQTAPAASPATSADAAALPTFDSLDKRHHGQLNRSDIPKDVDGLRDLRAHFVQYDKDNNGHINAQEYSRYELTHKPESEKKPGED
jgi:hypothetical protein